VIVKQRSEFLLILIKINKVNLEAELFSLDGKERFYLKSSKEISKAKELGTEVGNKLKRDSNNCYKK